MLALIFYTMCGHNIIKYKRFKELISSPTITEHLIRDNKVIIKLSNGKVGIAKCSPEDEFDIYKGTTLALARAYGTSEETQKTISLEQKKQGFRTKAVKHQEYYRRNKMNKVIYFLAYKV